MDVLGDEVGDHHARLVQHGVAEAEALVERGADEMLGAADGEVAAGPHERLELAAGDHLREYHRGRLERLDLFFRIDAPRAVLDNEDAQRLAATQDRHAHEGLVDLLARLRPVGEGGMLLGVGEIEGLGLGRNDADEAFAEAQAGLVDGLGLQALGGEQLQRAVGAQDIDRAHLRDHVGRDGDDNPVESFLRADRLRHELAKPAEHDARAADRAPHEFTCP